MEAAATAAQQLAKLEAKVRALEAEQQEAAREARALATAASNASTQQDTGACTINRPLITMHD